jgi:hypothetical protein
MTTEQIEILLKILIMIGAVIGFMIGLRRYENALRQYENAQAWKRHEFVAAEIRQFNGDHLTRNAMLMIDWGTRDIELFPEHPDYKSRFEGITRDVLKRALMTHDKVDRPYNRVEAAIRDCFDAFFDRLERFEEFIQAGLVKHEEFEPYLGYWIGRIADDVTELRSVLEEYADFYEFDLVPGLFKRFGKDFGTARRPAPEHRFEIASKYEDYVAAHSAGATILPSA